MLAVVPKGLVWLMDYGSVLTACLFEEEKSTTTHYHSPATTNQSSKHILAQLHLTKLHSNHKDQVVRIPPFSQSWASPPCPTTASPSHVPHAEWQAGGSETVHFILPDLIKRNKLRLYNQSAMCCFKMFVVAAIKGKTNHPFPTQ